MAKHRRCEVAMLFLLLPILSLLSVPNIAAQTYGGTAVFDLGGDPTTLNPALTTATYTHTPGAQIFNGLLTYTMSLEPKAELAKSWEVSGDRMTYTFHLEENVYWHDGKKFTSGDVKFTFEQVLKQYHPAGRVAFADLDRVETPDANTAVFKLKAPYEPLLVFLGSYHAPIIPAHLYEGTDYLKNEYNFKPVGTGPFKFKEYVPGSHVEIVRNENYWRKGLPYLDRMIFKIVKDATARVIALETGELDFVCGYPGIPESEVQRLVANPEVVVNWDTAKATSVLLNLIMNVRNAPLNNKKVRQALCYAIDKEEIWKKGLYGLGKPATGPISSVNRFYDPAVKNTYAYDVAKAEKLLDEAGYPRKADGVRFPLRFDYQTDSFSSRKCVEIIRDQLKKVGIDIIMDGVDYSTHINRVWTEYSFELSVHASDSGPDPSVAVGRHYLSTNIVKGVPNSNGAGYVNTHVDELFGKAVYASFDEAKKMYSEIQKIILDEAPIIPLMEQAYNAAWRSRIMGLPSWPYQQQKFEAVWIAPKVTSTSTVAATTSTTTSPTAPAVPWYSTAWPWLVAVLIVVSAAGMYWRAKKRK